ncbi:MAG TPA: hypothetical protein VFD45_02315 [Patescibacteria group bacterium]|nr:hypothetical protein [Patescibacteria group bacterium]
MHESHAPGRHRKIEKGSPEVVLTTNPRLATIIKGLSSTTPNWNALLKTLSGKQLTRMKENKTNGSKNGDTLGQLAETHVSLTLKMLSLEHPDLIVNPIPSGTETEDYVFRQYGHNYIAHNKRTGAAHIEYDALTLVCGLPVIWEVKLGHSFVEALKTTRISNISKPLIQHYHDSALGYVVITPKDSLNRSSKSQEEFTNKGGVMVTIPVTKTEFTETLQASIVSKGTIRDKPSLQPRRRPIII